MTTPDDVAFLQWAVPRLGLRWAGFRNVRGQVQKRVARRLRELGLASLDDYRARLAADPDEWAVLDSFCRISISRFYRDRSVFDHLQDTLLPELAALAVARGDRALRLLSAGCASGEEPYTLAMIGRYALSPRFPGLGLEILAVDADEHLLGRARRGGYEIGSLRELPLDYRDRAFEERQGLWFVRGEIRSLVTFLAADVRASLPEGPFHLALCRNLAFTYFDEPLQRAFAARLAERVIPGGALVVGGHEALPPDTPGWSAGPPGTRSYRRSDAP